MGELEMFRTNTATAEAGEIEQGDPHGDHADLVPLSHLSLDLPAPAEGWPAYLSSRDIAVVTDDLGRQAVSRGDARRLFAEQREGEARKREAMARIEQQAEAKDREFRSSLWQGLPSEYLPPGASPAAVMLQAAKDARPRRTTPLQHALQNSGELIYHPIAQTDEA
jgi:hypothetical protein